MAETIVSLAIESITDLLIQEAFFLGGVRGQVESLKDELERMKSFLKTVDRVQHQDEQLRTRVKQIRVLADNAEDVIDSFILKLAHQGGFHGLIKRYKNVFAKPVHLHKIGKQVKAIQTNLEGISKSLPAYKIPKELGRSSNSARQRGIRRSYPDAEEDDVVSLEVSTKDVIDLLMKEETRLHVVISIVGMGGLGKTTLAKKVYNHVDVKRHFDCYAWVYVSQKCLPRDVFHGILMKVLRPLPAEREQIDKLKEDDLVERLQNVLKENRYLVVLDDIWRCEQWDSVKAAFPKGNPGSKLLFTTRNKEVALYADPYSSPIELPFLTESQSLELLRRKAILVNEMESDPYSEEFEIMGKEMLKKCGGLPLAIVLLGGVLANKKSLNEWERVRNNINGYLNKLQRQGYCYGGLNGILDLSYSELPFHLKPCFLYLSNYPEDLEIPKKELIRLWIAEGFISESIHGETYMEDTAEEYLEELMNRCLVHVGRQDHTGGVKTCHIHDLLRDFCVFKADEENFLRSILPPKNEEGHCCVDLNVVAASKVRRVAVHLPEIQTFSLEGKCPSLRSLLLFSGEGWMEKLKISFKSLRFLRVLKLQTTSCPSEIGDLIHLRYFALRCSKVNFPPSIVNLRSLHTLLIRVNQIGVRIEIPNVVFKLERLRHLIVPKNGRSTMTIPRVLDTNLVSVETLKYVQIKDLIGGKVLLKLSNIRDLGIMFERSEDVEFFFNSFNLGRLQSLYLNIGFDFPFPNLEPFSHCYHLSKLSLVGKIPQLSPHQHALKFLPKYISKLYLMSSDLKHDPMVVLEKLPQLRSLCLELGSYPGTKMCCSANGFPVLTKLKMVGLVVLEEWEIEEGAMPHLEVLDMFLVDNLRMFPEGLKYVTTLQELIFYSVDRSLVESIQVINGKEGKDFYKVRHISTVKAEVLDFSE